MKKHITIIIVLLFGLAPRLLGQSLTPFSFDLNPTDYLSDTVGIAGQVALRGCPNIKISGVFGVDGPVIMEGFPGGQFQFTIPNVEIGYTYTYQVQFTKLTENAWAVQLVWESTPTQGPGVKGIKTPGIIKREGTGSLEPVTGTLSSGSTSSPSAIRTGRTSTDNGYYETIRIPYEIGYMADDGYHVVAGYITVTIFVPIPNVKQGAMDL